MKKPLIFRRAKISSIYKLSTDPLFLIYFVKTVLILLQTSQIIYLPEKVSFEIA